jgi:hypothetical protein
LVLARPSLRFVKNARVSLGAKMAAGRAKAATGGKEWRPMLQRRQLDHLA